MTLRTRSTLLIIGLVLLVSLLSWFVAARIVIRPFSKAVGQAMARQAVHIAEQLDEGARTTKLERSLGVEISRFRGEPTGRHDRMRHRDLWRRRGEIIVETDNGFLSIRRVLDLDRPSRRLPVLLLFPALITVLLATWIAGRALVPLEQATDAMRKMASGDLKVRLPIKGPSEFQEAARSFNAMSDRVRHMLQTERELLAGLSHELRTPLTRLQLELELQRGRLPPDRFAHLQQDLTALDQLVGEALELSRLQLGERTLERLPVDLHKLALSCAGDHVVVVGHGSTSGDERLLRRALDNVLANAIKYAPGPVEITVAPHVLRIQDWGPGVPEADLESVFRPFYRQHIGGTGLGLGLMIVRQIVELHGGSVRAANTEDGFLITFQLALRCPE